MFKPDFLLCLDGHMLVGCLGESREIRFFSFRGSPIPEFAGQHPSQPGCFSSISEPSVGVNSQQNGPQNCQKWVLQKSFFFRWGKPPNSPAHLCVAPQPSSPADRCPANTAPFPSSAAPPPRHLGPSSNHGSTVAPSSWSKRMPVDPLELGGLDLTWFLFAPANGTRGAVAWVLCPFRYISGGGQDTDGWLLLPPFRRVHRRSWFCLPPR